MPRSDIERRLDARQGKANSTSVMAYSGRMPTTTVVRVQHTRHRGDIVELAPMKLSTISSAGDVDQHAFARAETILFVRSSSRTAASRSMQVDWMVTNSALPILRSYPFHSPPIRARPAAGHLAQLALLCAYASER